MKAIKGKKTDKRGAKWIASLFCFDIVKASFIPPPDIRALRELSRYRLKLAYMRSAEKNRFQNSMTISHIWIDCVLTDPFGKTAARIMDYLLSGQPFDEDACHSLIHGGVKARLAPQNNESANKKKSIRCSRAGQYLKPLLIQCTLAAVKSRKQPYYAIKYQRITKRRGKKKAAVAIARMMLASIYHMLLSGENYHPNDYEAVIHSPKPKPATFTVENALQFLREQGADENTLLLLQQQCSLA